MRSVSTHQFLIIFILLFKPICCDAIGMDLQYCGFEQKCAGNKTNVEIKTESCCGRCECANICKEKGNCCKDKKFLDDNKHVVSQQCIPALYTPQGVGAAFRVQFFYARTRCPDEFQDLNIKEKCESSKPESLREITFVSSEDGSIIYKNKFCGICHSDKRTIPWKITVLKNVACRKLITKQNVNVSFITEYVLSHCDIEFEVPSKVDVRRVMCFEKNLVINQCNQTGKWDVYNSKLESLCLNPPESVYYINSTLVFGNLYCFLCNKKTTRVLGKCMPGSGRLHDIRPLFTLIDLDRWAEPRSHEGHRCRTDQILDTFLDRCKYLHCPRYALPVSGQCIPFMNVDLSYLLIVRLVPLENINKSESVKDEFKYKLNHIQRKLGFGGCKICFNQAYLAKENNEHFLQEIYIRYAFQPTVKCKIENLWSRLTLMERFSLNITLNLNMKVINFGAFWDNKKLGNNNQTETLYGHGFSKGCRYFSPERGSTCPKIQLTMLEYEEVLKKHSKVHDLWFVPNKEDMNNTVFVCIDNYILRARGVQKYVSVTDTIIAFLIAMLFRINLFV